MYSNESLSRLICDMCKVDQGLRLLAKDGQGLLNYMIYLADMGHNYRIHKIISDGGYPISASIGTKAMKDFWLLIQHQDYDLNLQQACLDNCDFEPQEKAFLTDRVRMNMGKPQIYGTQYIMSNGKRELYSLEETSGVEELRKSVNLPPLNDQDD